VATASIFRLRGVCRFRFEGDDDVDNGEGAPDAAALSPGRSTPDLAVEVDDVDAGATGAVNEIEGDAPARGGTAATEAEAVVAVGAVV
jgi:hypothetical protein